MAKFFSCRFCLVEMERFKLADGTVALVCVACDVIGLEHEMAHGGPLRPAGLSGTARAAKTLRGIQAAWIKEQRVRCENGRIAEYQVNMMVTFVLDD